MEHGKELNEAKQSRGGNDIVFIDFLAIAFRSGWLILGVTLGTMAIALAGALYLSKYKSEGFLQFGGAIPLPKQMNERDLNPGILLGDYKRYAAAFSNSGRFSEFVAQNKLEDTPGIGGLRQAFGSRDSVAAMVQPVFPFTKLDAKELMEQPKDSSNNVIGLHINYSAASPVVAQQMVGLLGRYTMDSIMYLIYSDALRFKHTEITAKILKLDNDIIDNKEKLEAYRRKGEALRKIVGRYPEAASQSARQVVSVTEDNARYLSPSTHLMSSEVETSMANEAIHKARRDQQQSMLLREYYDSAKVFLEGTKSGEAILRGLEPVKEKVFKNKDLNDEVIKEVYNTISIDNQNAISLYLEKSRFIAGPILPESRSSHLPVVFVVSLLLGFHLSLLLVFIRYWWRQNGAQWARARLN